MTYYLNNEDGLINLYRYDRTNKNHLTYSKGDSVGKIMAVIVNELDLLLKDESISVTIEKPLSGIREINDTKSQWSDSIVEYMKQLGKVINSTGVKVSDPVNTSYEDCRIQTPPDPIGYLELEEAMTRLPVFKRIGWFRRMMLRWAFGLKYIKEE